MSRPAVVPVTTPEDEPIVAFVFVVLQVPVPDSLSVVVPPPAQTAVEPEIGPATPFKTILDPLSEPYMPGYLLITRIRYRELALVLAGMVAEMGEVSPLPIILESVFAGKVPAALVICTRYGPETPPTVVKETLSGLATVLQNGP